MAKTTVRETQFFVNDGKLVCPDGKEYELRNTTITISNEMVEVPMDDTPGAPTIHVQLAFSTFRFGDSHG